MNEERINELQDMFNRNLPNLNAKRKNIEKKIKNKISKNCV